VGPEDWVRAEICTAMTTATRSSSCWSTRQTPTAAACHGLLAQQLPEFQALPLRTAEYDTDLERLMAALGAGRGAGAAGGAAAAPAAAPGPCFGETSNRRRWFGSSWAKARGKPACR